MALGQIANLLACPALLRGYFQRLPPGNLFYTNPRVTC